MCPSPNSTPMSMARNGCETTFSCVGGSLTHPSQPVRENCLASLLNHHNNNNNIHTRSISVCVCVYFVFCGFWLLSSTTRIKKKERTMMISFKELTLAVVVLLSTTVSAANYTNSQYSSAYSSSSSSSSAYGVNFFAESENSYYDGYQQAWRYLGWYVACGHPSDRYNGGSGSHDSNEDRQMGNMYCQRYLMWAAVSFVYFVLTHGICALYHCSILY